MVGRVVKTCAYCGATFTRPYVCRPGSKSLWVECPNGHCNTHREIATGKPTLPGGLPMTAQERTEYIKGKLALAAATDQSKYRPGIGPSVSRTRGLEPDEDLAICLGALVQAYDSIVAGLARYPIAASLVESRMGNIVRLARPLGVYSQQANLGSTNTIRHPRD